MPGLASAVFWAPGCGTRAEPNGPSLFDHRRRPPAASPPPVRELAQAFVMSDANGQSLAYVYFRHDPNEARQANVLTLDEAGASRCPPAPLHPRPISALRNPGNLLSGALRRQRSEVRIPSGHYNKRVSSISPPDKTMQEAYRKRSAFLICIRGRVSDLNQPL